MTVTISLEEYTELKSRSEWLGYLESAGVDNWGGIEYAYEMRSEDNPDEEI